MGPSAMQLRAFLFASLALCCAATLTGRSLLPTNKGCYQVKDFDKCCQAIDSRYSIDDGKFGGERCFPAAKGKKFSSGNKCEPEVWINEKSARRVTAGVCGDEGFGGKMMHQIDRILLSLQFYGKPDTKIVVAILALIAPLVLLGEALAFVQSLFAKPGAAPDDLSGQVIMGMCFIFIIRMVLGA